MKKVLTILITLLTTSAAISQQLPSFSHYMQNDFVINPAVAGSKDHFVTRLAYRNQWIGFEGAPVTETLSIHGRIKYTNNSVGGFLYNDVTGPSRRSGLNVTYSYRVPFKNFNLSFGLQGGVFQYFIDGTKMTTGEPDDGAVPLSTENVIVPDAGFGIYTYSEKFYTGFSIPQLIEAKVKFKDVDKIQVSRLKKHYCFFGGLYVKLSETLTLEPSGLIKGVQGAPIQIDFNAKFHFDDMYWLGISYRTRGAIVALAGLQLQERFYIGYAYDLTLTGLQSYNNGSHEIILGYDFKKEKVSRSMIKFK